MLHPNILVTFIAVFSMTIGSSGLTFAYSKTRRSTTRSSSVIRRPSYTRPQTRARNHTNSGWSRSKYSSRIVSSRNRGTRAVPSSSWRARSNNNRSYNNNNKNKRFSTAVAMSSSSSKSKQGAYCYSLNLENGKKYVGYTKDIGRRLKRHFSGRGAKVTQQVKPLSVNHMQRCTSVENAKKAENIVYNIMKNYHGIDRVRGAGHTKRFFNDGK
mmetsp:Transcript_16803/g.31834  ORF Transcript_16803/g.31834 Transcript_16803/m.31834 type:complete len:213 (-) Transcript_16803:330-968(-)